MQNVEEIQKSAAVLDFTKLNNQDTAKANSYAGMHYKDDDCIAYVRFNNDGLPYIGDPDGNSGLIMETITVLYL